MTQELMQAFVGGGGNKQLVARADADFKTKAITLDNAINAAVKRGALIRATGWDQPFVLVDTGAGMPAATDVVAVVADDIDLTGAAADVVVNAFVAGEFIKESVFAASKGTILAADKVTLEEYLSGRQIWLVHTMYGANTESLV